MRRFARFASEIQTAVRVHLSFHTLHFFTWRSAIVPAALKQLKPPVFIWNRRAKPSISLKRLEKSSRKSKEYPQDLISALGEPKRREQLLLRSIRPSRVFSFHSDFTSIRLIGSTDCNVTNKNDSDASFLPSSDPS